MTKTKEFPKLFKTTILGIGPFCVEFADGEIICVYTEERQHLIAVAPELLCALRNMTALANNMRETIEGGNFPTQYEIPRGYFNTAYAVIEKVESFQKP